MSTLSEIECTLPLLTLEELRHLDMAVDSQLMSRCKPKVRTARDARDWWKTVEVFSTTEAEDFARDIEDGRKMLNQQSAERWAE